MKLILTRIFENKNFCHTFKATTKNLPAELMKGIEGAEGTDDSGDTGKYIIKFHQELLSGSVLLYIYVYIQQATQIFTGKRSKIYLVMHAVLDADIGEPERWKISTA